MEKEWQEEFFEKQNELITAIVQQVSDAIPGRWENFYLNAEISDNLSGGIYFFFNIEKNKNYIYCEDIPDIYNVYEEEYEERRDVLYKALKKIDGVECKPPKGAFYITVKLPVPDAEEFLVWLLSKFSYDGASVMFAPAKDFYTTEGLGKDEVRLAYVLNKEDLLKAADILKYGISEYNKEQ